MRTQPKVGRADAATLWARDSRSWVRSSLLAGLTLLVQVLQAPLLKDLNTLVDSQSPGAAVSGKGFPPKGGYATNHGSHAVHSLIPKDWLLLSFACNVEVYTTVSIKYSDDYN